MMAPTRRLLLFGRLRRTPARFDLAPGPPWRSVIPCLSADPATDYWLNVGLYVAGAYFLITALIGSCLIYRLLDVDSHVHGGTYHSGEDVYDGRGGN